VLAVDDAVLVGDDEGDGAGGSGEVEGGCGGGAGFAAGVGGLDLGGGDAGGLHVELGELAEVGELAVPALGVRFGGRWGVPGLRAGGGGWHWGE